MSYKNFISSFVAKGGAALSAFLVTFLVARVMSNVEAGYFFLGLSIFSFSIVVLRLGLDNYILRNYSSLGSCSFSDMALIRSLSWVLIASTFFSLVGFVLSRYLAFEVFSKPAFESTLKLVFLSLPFAACFMIYSFVMQGLGALVWASFFLNFGFNSIFLLLLLVYSFLYGFNVDSYDSFLFLLGAIFIVFIIFLIKLFWQIRSSKFHFSFFSKEQWSASSKFWFASMMSQLVIWSGIFFSGIYLESEDVSLISTAQRTALLMSFILLVVNNVTARKYAIFWANGDLSSIESLAKRSTHGMMSVAAPIALFLIIFSESIMGLFGEGYSKAGMYLVVLVFAQYVNIATGSVGYLLSMTGNERDYLIVTLLAGPITTLTCWLLTLYYEAIGSVFGLAFGILFQNVAALIAVRYRLGFWVFGFKR